MTRKARRATDRGFPLDSPPVAVRRVFAVDAMRGIAVGLMVTYHFCFDLNYFGFVHIDFHSSRFWLASRALIVTLFLLVVGASLHLATAKRIPWAAIRRRLALILVCAALVSGSSYILFPASAIYFGVLHFVAMASALGLLFRRYHVLNLFAGLACVAAGLFFQAPTFDHPWLNWIGFATHKPITEDYVPVFPWFGVVLLGLFLGKHVLSASSYSQEVRTWRPPGRTANVLSWVGAHSLAIYMLHQPLLLSLLYVVSSQARA